MKVALVTPAATVTLAGISAAALLIDRLTAAPPLGAAPLKVTVPVEELPPVTVVGLKLNALTVGSGAEFTVTIAVCEVPL